MEYRTLGKSGLKLSLFSLGSWVTFKNQVDLREAEKMLKTAYDHGINFFDNAEAYAEGESEKIMGAAIERLGWSRDSFCVSSKVYWGGQLPTQRGLSRKHVVDACHAALRRLRVEYLDLYFCHRPDLSTPIEETVRAMHDLVQQGKILYWGTSEWNAQQITEAFAVARENHLTPPTMEQPEYNMFRRERMESELVPLFENYGLGTTIWSPLASGILTGKYRDGIQAGSRAMLPGYEWLRAKFESEEGKLKIRKAEELRTLADEIGISLTHLALAWCAKNPWVSSVILGASREEQLLENLKALAHMNRLTPEVLNRIEEILQNQPPKPVEY